MNEVTTEMYQTANIWNDGFHMGMRNGVFFTALPLTIIIILLLVFYRRKAVKQQRK